MIGKMRKVAMKTMPPGGRLWLYGSRARGDATEQSDWDLLIILDKPKLEQSDYDNISFPLTELGWETGDVILPTMYTKTEWEGMSFMPYYKNVERDKVVII